MELNTKLFENMRYHKFVERMTRLITLALVFASCYHYLQMRLENYQLINNR